MKIREHIIDNKSYLFPKDILNKTFLFDDKAGFKIKNVNKERPDKESYIINVIYESEKRPLCLTKHAFRELRIATSNCAGIVVRVRFDGKQGDKKATRWLFSVVTNESSKESDKKEPFTIMNAMR